MPTVKDIICEIEKIAKPKYAYDWDNCGLCAGDRQAKVKNILITLDVTVDVVKEAVDKNCQMIVSHHPLIFKPISNADVESLEGQILSLLFKNEIALYCAHTSLDIALGGVNDALAEKLDLINVKQASTFEIDGENISCLRVGAIKKELSKQELIDFIKEKTGAKTLNYYLEDKKYEKIALSTGAGEEFAFECADEDVFLTGEIKYHTALELKRRNISFIAAGHYYTEIHFVDKFKACLQNAVNMLQYDVTFLASETNTNPFEN